MKNWIKYTIYTISIIILVFAFDYFSTNLKLDVTTMDKLDSSGHGIITFLFFSVLGILIGFEHLVYEIQKDGDWKVNLPKLIFLSIPSLYICLSLIVFPINNEFLNSIFKYPLYLFTQYGFMFIGIFYLLLSYSIMTSFYRKRDHKYVFKFK